MPLCQLFINKEEKQFMLVQMPDEVTPDNYQEWVEKKEQESGIQVLELSQSLLDRIALGYLNEDETQSYQAKYVLMKAPEEKALFVSSLEISQNDDEKLDIVRNGLLIVFDEDELQHFTSLLQNAWKEE